MKLTREQQLIVEENHNLIYSYARDYKLDLEEWYGLLAIQLCKAVATYDSNKGKLSTLYYTMCTNKRYREYRKAGAKKRDSGFIKSLEWDVETEDGGITLEDMIEDTTINILEDTINNEILNDMLEGEYGEIVKLRYIGYSQDEIADILGCSQANISRILNKLKGEYFL